MAQIKSSTPILWDRTHTHSVDASRIQQYEVYPDSEYRKHELWWEAVGLLDHGENFSFGYFRTLPAAQRFIGKIKLRAGKLKAIVAARERKLKQRSPSFGQRMGNFWLGKPKPKKIRSRSTGYHKPKKKAKAKARR